MLYGDSLCLTFPILRYIYNTRVYSNEDISSLCTYVLVSRHYLAVTVSSALKELLSLKYHAEDTCNGSSLSHYTDTKLIVYLSLLALTSQRASGWDLT